MAFSLFPSITYNIPKWGNSILSLQSNLILFPCSINQNPTSPIHLHRSFSGATFKPNRSILRSSLSPPPTPPGKEPHNLTGTAATFTKLWDTVQIFFAVFVWMSLFFWASASDRKNTGSKNKNDRFRK